MKEINIAKVLVSKRKEKGVTQETLADYIGVSKASVSKWEIGQSYPDIVFLPQLASYFNISIDELIDYKPQMTKEDIRKTYHRLAAAFAAGPFDEVAAECREIIKKYFSCFPLLLQMGILLVNHSMLAKDSEKTAALLAEAKDLFIRVKTECEDMELVRQAVFMEAMCCIAANDPNAALDLLKGQTGPALPPETLLASAYQMTGRTEEAKATLQVGMYQNLVVQFNFFPAYLMLCVDEPNRYEEILRRAIVTAETFDMKHLHPGVLIGLYIAAAQGYTAQENTERALDMLQEYTDIVTADIYPLKLHGDGFFHLIDPWLSELDLGTELPRDDKTVKQSMADVIISNPSFEALAKEPRFQKMVERLKSNCE